MFFCLVLAPSLRPLHCFLLCSGYARGPVNVWSLSASTVIQTIAPGGGVEQALAFVKWMSAHNLSYSFSGDTVTSLFFFCLRSQK